MFLDNDCVLCGRSGSSTKCFVHQTGVWDAKQVFLSRNRCFKRKQAFQKSSQTSGVSRVLGGATLSHLSSFAFHFFDGDVIIRELVEFGSL